MNETIDLFKIRAHVPDFEAISEDYRTMSDAARASIRFLPDLAYGSHEDERLDLFLPENGEGPAPVHLFIHGGYWRANRKEDYAFVAAPVVGAGAIAAIVGYSRMPRMRMVGIVDQVRRAEAWVGAHAGDYGGDATMISASGHSAGAHLAAYLAARGPHEAAMTETPVRSLLLVSGIYALGPITRSFLQAEIMLTPEEVERWSPCDAASFRNVPVTLAVGANETEPFHRQAEDYGAVLARHGIATERMILPGLDHMSVVRDLGRRETALAGLLVEMIGRSRSGGA